MKAPLVNLIAFNVVAHVCLRDEFTRGRKHRRQIISRRLSHYCTQVDVEIEYRYYLQTAHRLISQTYL